MENTTLSTAAQAAIDALVAAVRAGAAVAPEVIAGVLAIEAELVALAQPPIGDEPYSRRALRGGGAGDAEVMLAGWRPGARCAVHDHGGSRGVVLPVRGEFVEERHGWSGDELRVAGTAVRRPGEAVAVDGALIHAMGPRAEGVSLHVYAPPATRMGVYDVVRGQFYDVHGDVGAWIPPGDAVAPTSFAAARRAGLASAGGTAVDGAGQRPVIWVGHTTHYRGGSAEFAVVARTLARDLAAAHPDAEVIVAPLQRKADFVRAHADLAAAGRRLRELHFVGHSGMYGIMFGSVAWPEQFSPHEWRTLAATGGIAFAHGARAYFHACRTGRWFAPFIARTFGITAHGHHGYTTVSTRADRFSWAGPRAHTQPQLYLVATPGKKSHGLLGSVKKYRGAAAEPMLVCEPARPTGTTSYDKVAELYDRAYVDIRVRGPEWAWVKAHAEAARADLGRPLRLLEVGCGNGALLRALDDEGLLERGQGLDDSVEMLARAQARSAGRARLQFGRIVGPVIDAPDSSVDVVLSFLSFRYLDWDPLMAEIRRVLAPGGRVWMVDMVEQPVRARELHHLARGVVQHALAPRQHPQFAADLAALTAHPDWQTMVKYNPIRAEHEYKWYFESRFPGRTLELLNVTPRQRVVAFDTGPLPKGQSAPLSFP